MNKFYLFIGVVIASNVVSVARESKTDSVKVITLQEVSVVSTRATSKTPMAYSNVGKGEIAKINFGQDIPYLLSMTPSAITTSDGGAGIGYTTLRVRGTDATRINITSNGVPMNDAESHGLFWVNMPDFASSLQNVQIQRGAGTSTNGAGAFGASVNMLTEPLATKPFAELNGSYGMYNTHKETLKFGTGLINGHWAFDARLSNIGTDGYIDRASVSLYSYFAQGGYFTDKMSIKLITFGGKEKTYHAWNYASKEEMEKYGRRYNSCGRYKDENGNVHFYDDQTDNYIQTHYQLLFNRILSPELNLNIALHYTRGDGYYQEYKSDRTLAEYGLNAFKNESGAEVTISNLVRQKKMENDFGGGVFSLNYKKGRLDGSIGGGLNCYDGSHFGKVIWVKNYIGALSPDHEYYRNNTKKTDGNIYAKASYEILDGLSAFADLQYRHINYKLDGANDNYDESIKGMQKLNYDENFNFFNPKVGINWNVNANNRVYASFSIAQKEPTRNNYTDGKALDHPKAEKLNDYELGYVYANNWLTAGANLYYMDYKDQLVLTGELNEIGEPMAANVPNSYRMGVELQLGMKPLSWFRWDINGTLSQNKIKNFVEKLYDDGTNPIEITHGNTQIAFSPNFIFNNRFAFNYKGFDAAFQTQYVSKQYMSNAQQDDLVLDAYCVTNLNLAYTFILPQIKSLTLGFTVYNLFNEEYENNGYAESGYYKYEAGKPVRYNYAGYAAQAGINIMGSVSIRF